MQPITLLVTALGLTVLFTAVWRGGGPERAGAGIVFAAFLLDQLYHAVAGPHGFNQFDAGELAIDMTSLLLFVGLALRANRLWPIFVAALHLVAVLGHLVVLVREGQPLVHRAYWAMTEPPMLLSIFALAGALIAHRLRQHRLGNYPDWRPA